MAPIAANVKMVFLGQHVRLNVMIRRHAMETGHVAPVLAHATVCLRIMEMTVLFCAMLK